jgi:hypothetical protein
MDPQVDFSRLFVSWGSAGKNVWVEVKYRLDAGRIVVLRYDLAEHELKEVSDEPSKIQGICGRVMNSVTEEQVRKALAKYYGS